jgi:NhaA family Na+:H+ antiporter
MDGDPGRADVDPGGAETSNEAGETGDEASDEGKEFSGVEAAAGAVLIAAAAVALLWANSPWSSGYHAFWNHHLGGHWLGLDFPHSPAGWVGDLMMAVYFFVAGLEVKRELTAGELRSPRRAAFPIAAAVGGMLVPALIYAACNPSGAGSNGWGVPMATDIAFALGVLAVLGRNLPSQVRVFLLSLAIVDDVGSIVVIVVFYSRSLSPIWFLVAAAFVVLIYGGYQMGGRRLWVVAIGALGLWVSLFQAGIHPTIAGVICGLLTPAVEDERGHSTAEKLLHRFHPWSSFVIAPLFAVAAAGVKITGDGLHAAVTDPVAIGVFVGLVVGKPVGILAGAGLSTKLGWATRPAAITWPRLGGVGAIAGIGFTVSFLISELAFARADLRNASQLAILAAALAAIVVGAVVLFSARRGRSPSLAQT